MGATVELPDDVCVQAAMMRSGGRVYSRLVRFPVAPPRRMAALYLAKRMGRVARVAN